MTHENFWAPSRYYVSPERVTDEAVARVESLLGFRLPAAYLALLRTQNGGTPNRRAFPTRVPTSWAEDHVEIDGIAGIGGEGGLDADSGGSHYMIDEWGYPPIGVLFGHCPSGGHDAFMLDYHECGPSGEPAVAHVELESDAGPTITKLAPDSASFLAGLVDASIFDDA